jgi:hypothetical protein
MPPLSPFLSGAALIRCLLLLDVLTKSAAQAPVFRHGVSGSLLVIQYWPDIMNAFRNVEQQRGVFL